METFMDALSSAKDALGGKRFSIVDAPRDKALAIVDAPGGKRSAVADAPCDKRSAIVDAPRDKGSAVEPAPAMVWTRSLAGAWTRAVATLAAVRVRRQQRYRLQQLDDRLLKDIGLSRADADREWRRPFWRA